MSVPLNKRTKPTQFNVVTKAMDIFEHTRKMLKNEKHFPKKERFMLVKDIYELSKNIVCFLNDANELKLNVEWEKDLRQRRQKESIMACRNLTYLIRQAWLEQYISVGSYEYWVKEINALITMIIAWQKSDSKR